MEPGEVLAELLALAREVGVVVRPLAGGSASTEGEPPPVSGVCRVRGTAWVLLSRADPPDAQIAVLARALRAEAGARLESRWLPPAVRAALSPGDAGSGPDVSPPGHSA